MGELRAVPRCPSLVLVMLVLSCATFMLAAGATTVQASTPVTGVSARIIDAGQNLSLYTSATFPTGTPPFTCLWLEKGPGMRAYTNLGSGYACSIPGRQNTTMVASAPTGVWSYELRVTDSSGIPKTMTTIPISVKINKALGTPVLDSSIDVGQVFTSVSLSWSGGSSTYTVRLYGSATSACSAASTPLATKSAVTTLSYTFAGLSQYSSLWFCATVTDSAGTPVTANASATHLTVNPQLSVSVVSASSPYVDLRQSVTLSANFTGGTSPYTCQWLVLRPSASIWAKLGLPTTCSSSSTASSGVLGVSGAWNFKVQVTDKAVSPTTVTSLSPVTVTVNALPKAVKITTTPSSLPQGQNSTLSFLFSGGIPPYTCQWLDEAPLTKVYVDQGSSFGCSASTTTLNSTGALQTVGSWRFKLQITDSSGTPYTATSLVYIVTVYPTLTLRAIAPSASAIDVTQSVTVTVTWTGGKPTFTVKLYNSSTSSCGSWSTLLSTKSVKTTLATFKGLPALSNNTWYCATVTDGSTLPVSIATPSQGIAVNPLPTTSSVLASASKIDVGQGVTLSANFTGGTSPFTCQWIQQAPGTTKASSFISITNCNPASLFTVSTGALSIPGTWAFQFRVIDSSHGPVTVTSPPVYVIVSLVLGTPTLSLSSNKIDTGQSVNATVYWIGGTPGFTVWFYSSPSTTCGPSSTLLGNQSVTSSPVRFTGLPNITASTYYCASVSDILGAPSLKTSAPSEVMVFPSLSAPSAAVLLSSVSVNQSTFLLTQTYIQGGVSPYTCQWLVEAPSASTFSTLGSSFACTSSAYPTQVSTGSLATAGVWQFEIEVTDSSGTRVTAVSTPVTVNVS